MQSTDTHNMGIVPTSTAISTHDGLTSQVLLLFVSQLCTHYNTEHDLELCRENLKLEDSRRKQRISLMEENYSKLFADYSNIEILYREEARHTDSLTETLEEYVKKISALEELLHKKTLAGMACERDEKLQAALEQMNKELHENRNCTEDVSGMINQTLATLQLISQNQNVSMEPVSSSTPLPSDDAHTLEPLLLLFVNQLCTQRNKTTQYTEEEVQNCVASLKQEGERKELISRQQEVNSTLYAEYSNLEILYHGEARHTDSLTQTLKEYVEKIRALEEQLQKETLAGMVFEGDEKLQAALEQMNKELQENRNSTEDVSGMINQTLATLQLISQNQNVSMEPVSTSTPLSSDDAHTLEPLLLLFVNQLCTQRNKTTQYTEEEVQNCVASLKQEGERRKELISRQQEDYSKLSAEFLHLQNLYTAARAQIDNLTETSKMDPRRARH